jgi:hypothetical protein
MAPAKKLLAQELVKWLQKAVNHSDKIELYSFTYINLNLVYIDQPAAPA